MMLFKLAIRSLWRDKFSSELQILAGSLIIAIALSVAIACFNARLNFAMLMRANEFLAADLVLESTSNISSQQAQIIHNLTNNKQLQHAQTVEFASVITTNDAMLLVSAKAISDNYPLRGKLQTSTNYEDTNNKNTNQKNTNNENYFTNGVPNLGEIWIEARVLTGLNLKLGNKLTLGKQNFVVSRIIISEPDRNNDFYSFNPRIIININDLENAGVIAPGSRVKYRELVSGKSEYLQQFITELKPTLLANQKILDIKNANNQISSALKRAEQYLNLATMVAVILSAIAITLSANRFALKRLNNSALLRCFGLTYLQTLKFFSLQLLALWLITSLIGLTLGYLIQLGLFYLLQNLVNVDIALSSIAPFVSASFIGLIALAGFSLPGIITLSKTPPLKILRSDVSAPKLSLWLIYSLAICAIALIMWYLALDIILLLILIAAGIAICLLFGVPMFYVMRFLRQYVARKNFALRMSLGQLLRYPLATTGQILAFGLILMCMALVILLRSELLDDWHKQLPQNAPNHFAFNIMPYELEDFKHEIAQISNDISPFYPIFMGRITQINGKNVNLDDKDTDKINALKRDLNLTFTTKLPKDNVITAGSWGNQTANQTANQNQDNNQDNTQTYISIEEKLAKTLKVAVGDEITFQIAGKTIVSKITSLRTVNWENFLPNFFVIFTNQFTNNLEGSLEGNQKNTLENNLQNNNIDNKNNNFTNNFMDNLAVTYLASFYIAPENEAKLLTIAKQFAAATILPITSLIKQIRAIINQVTLAVEYVLLFVLGAGIMVLLAGLQSSIDERMQSSSMLRALGASKKIIRKIMIFEFALLGLFSGFFALIGAEIACFALYKWLFKLSFSFHLQLLLLPIIGVLLISIVGLLGTRKLMIISPLKVLRSL